MHRVDDLKGEREDEEEQLADEVSFVLISIRRGKVHVAKRV